MSSNLLAVNGESGMAMTEEDWLQIHYQACAAGYAEQMAFCEFERGCRLVDVGCGPGLFLPILARQLGPGSEIVACDVSQSLLDSARRQHGDSIFGCKIEYRHADAVQMPFADGSFDAYWSANVSQYLDDDQFQRMLAEARRITRRGGRVACKDWDAALFRIEPSAPGTTQRLMEACERAYRAGSSVPIITNIHRAMTCSHIGRWLTASGFRDVRQHSTLIEFAAPLSQPKRLWCERLLPMCAQIAHQLGSPDQEFWSQFSTRALADTVIADPEFCCTEGSTVGVAVAP